jgi:hypothetical protein
VADAGLDADVVLDIRAALTAVGRLEAELDRASHVVVTADSRAVTASIDAAVQNADTGVAVVAEAANVTGAIDAAVENADTSVTVSGSVDPGLAAGVNDIGDELDAAATSGINLGAILAGISVTAVVAGLRALADAASDLQESTSKATVVFGSSFGEIEQFADNAAGATGLAKQEALEATATFGNLFQALGSTREEAAAMSPDVVQLAADLASFNNLGVDEVLEKLRSGLVGEVEPLRSLGVSFLAADVAAKGLELGIADATGAMTEGAKVQARLALIMEQTSLAQGDFGRTSEGLANQQRILGAELGNAAAKAGTLLLPAFEAIIAEGRDMIPGLLQLAENVLPALGSSLVALAPLLGTGLDLLVALSPVVQALATAIGLIPAPVIQAVAVLLTLNKALKLIQATTKVGIVTGLASQLANLAVPAGSVAGAFNGIPPASGRALSSLRGLTTGLSGATAAAGLAFTAFTLYQGVMADATAEGEAFGATIRESVGDLGTKSMAELNRLTTVLDQEIVRMSGDVDDSFLGRNGVNRDFNAALHEGIDQMEQLRAEAEAAKKALRLEELNKQYGPLIESLRDTGTALDSLSESAPEVASSISALRLGAVDATADSFEALTFQIGAAALSEEQMADAAALLGTDVETLTAVTKLANDTLESFVDTATGALPTVADAFKASGEDGVLSVREFVSSLEESTLSIQVFRGDLAKLAEAGFSDIAGIIAEQGPEVGGGLARELVTALETGNVEVLDKVREATNGFNNEWLTTTAFFRDTIGPEMILQSGLLGAGITEAFGSELTFSERIRIAAALAKSGMSTEGQAVAAIAAVEGERAARDYGAALDLDQKVIDEAVKAGTALTTNAPDGHPAGVKTGSGFGQGIVDGMTLYTDDINTKAAQLVLSARSAAARASQEGSPSKLFRTLGENMALGVAQGIDAEVAAVTAAAERLVVDAAAAAAGVPIATVDLTAASSASSAASGGGDTSVVFAAGSIVVRAEPGVTREEAVAVGQGIIDGAALALENRRIQVLGRVQ